MQGVRIVLFLLFTLSLTATGEATINYNASKSNTGNVTVHCKQSSHCRGHMAVKGSGVPQNTGMASGRRIHRPLLIH
jgi:hypothetical protein